VTKLEGFLWAEEHMLLKIVLTTTGADMPLTHHLMSPLHKNYMDCFLEPQHCHNLGVSI